MARSLSPSPRTVELPRLTPTMPGSRVFCMIPTTVRCILRSCFWREPHHDSLDHRVSFHFTPQICGIQSRSRTQHVFSCVSYRLILHRLMKTFDEGSDGDLKPQRHFFSYIDAPVFYCQAFCPFIRPLHHHDLRLHIHCILRVNRRPLSTQGVYLRVYLRLCVSRRQPQTSEIH